MTEVEVFDFVQILFNPEVDGETIKEGQRMEGNTIRVLLSALRTASVGAVVLIT
jgi:hypothetical protein